MLGSTDASGLNKKLHLGSRENPVQLWKGPVHGQLGLGPKGQQVTAVRGSHSDSASQGLDLSQRKSHENVHMGSRSSTKH